MPRSFLTAKADAQALRRLRESLQLFFADCHLLRQLCSPLVMCCLSLLFARVHPLPSVAMPARVQSSSASTLDTSRRHCWVRASLHRRRFISFLFFFCLFFLQKNKKKKR